MRKALAYPSRWRYVQARAVLRRKLAVAFVADVNAARSATGFHPLHCGGPLSGVRLLFCEGSLQYAFHVLARVDSVFFSAVQCRPQLPALFMPPAVPLVSPDALWWVMKQRSRLPFAWMALKRAVRVRTEIDVVVCDCHHLSTAAGPLHAARSATGLTRCTVVGHDDSGGSRCWWVTMLIDFAGLARAMLS